MMRTDTRNRHHRSIIMVTEPVVVVIVWIISIVVSIF